MWDQYVFSTLFSKVLGSSSCRNEGNNALPVSNSSSMADVLSKTSASAASADCAALDGGASADASGLADADALCTGRLAALGHKMQRQAHY